MKQKTPSRPFQRLLTVVLILVILFIGLVFWFLPSPYRIKEIVYRGDLKKTLIHDGKSRAVPSPVAANVSPNEVRDHSQSKQEAEISQSPEAKKSRQLFEKLIDRSKPLSSACQTLRHRQSRQKQFASSIEFGERLQVSLEEESTDALIESVKPLLKFTLIQPEIQNVISKVEAAKDQSEMKALIEKAEFYRSLYGAYQEMLGNRVQMERILDQNYLTMMLGRLVEVRPELAGDSDIINYCEQIEAIINTDSEVQFDEQMKAFSEFLGQAGVDSREIQFNPHYKTRLEIIYSPEGLRFKGGWIEDIFSTLQSMKKTRSEDPSKK